MNLRILKKQCRRAMETLIAEHRYKRSDFQPAEGGESIYAPEALERRFEERGFIHPGPLKGTMLLWVKMSYEYDEWDAKLPSEFLAEIEFWSKFEPDPKDLAVWDAHADACNAALATAEPGSRVTNGERRG